MSFFRLIAVMIALLMPTVANACGLVHSSERSLDKCASFGIERDGKARKGLYYPLLANWLGEVSMQAFRIENGALSGPSEKAFTFNGQEEFISLLEEDEILSKMVRESSSAMALIQHVPVLIFSGSPKDVFMWEYDVPMILMSDSADMEPFYFTAHARIIRTDDSNFECGLAIDKWSLIKGRQY